MTQPDLNDVAMFVRVVRRGSFASAARELGVPTSTASRVVARLEAALGTRLLQRTTRTLRPTAEGRDYFAEVAPALATLETASRGAAPDDHPRGRLRMVAPPDIGSTFLVELVARYARRFPEVELDVELTSREVDLVAEGVDVALRFGPLADSSLVARRIGEDEAIVVAAPAYLAGHGTLRTPDALPEHVALMGASSQGRTVWTLRSGSREKKVEVHGRITARDLTLLRNAALAGAGVALLPRVLCAADVHAGRLVHLLPDWSAAGPSAWFVMPSARHVPARVAAMRDLVFETHRSCLASTAAGSTPSGAGEAPDTDGRERAGTRRPAARATSSRR